MRKRAITLTLALLMCLSCALPVSASGGSRFTDVPDNAWYAEAVNAMADGGVLMGKGNGKFDPDAPVTLAELSVIYCRLWGKEITASGGHWATSAMEFATLGMEPDDFSRFPYADEPAYRADALSALAQWVNGWESLYYLEELHVVRDSNFNPTDYVPTYSYIDLSTISDRDEYYAACKFEETMWPSYYYLQNGHNFFAEDIDYAYKIGLTHGIDEHHTCDAFGTLTRAQLAQMCYNMGWTTVGSLKEYVSPMINFDWWE